VCYEWVTLRHIRDLLGRTEAAEREVPLGKPLDALRIPLT
jgi:hypothetical protein